MSSDGGLGGGAQGVDGGLCVVGGGFLRFGEAVDEGGLAHLGERLPRLVERELSGHVEMVAS